MEPVRKWPSASELPSLPDMPDPTVSKDGKKIRDLKGWESQRAYLKEMIAHYMFGHYPEDRDMPRSETVSKELRYNGKAVEEKRVLRFGKEKTVSLRVRLLYPNREGERFPLIIDSTDYAGSPLPLEEKAVTEYGFAIAEFCRLDLCKDRSMLETLLAYRSGTLVPKDEAVLKAVRRMDSVTPEEIDLENIHPLAEAYPDCDWGELAQWGFGYLVCTDCFSALPQINSEKICFTGHSRLGKAALCAGIFDDRASIVNPNASGCGGVGSLRLIGDRAGNCQDPEACEAVGGITHYAPGWFVPEFADFGDNRVFPEKESHLPFDGNTLRAVIAPRACFTTEGLDDYWSNPRGTQFAWEAAQPLFDALGIPERNGIHYREGGHGHIESDWQALLTYCRFLWFGEPLTDDINQTYFTRQS